MSALAHVNPSGLPGRLREQAWHLPPDLTEEAWAAAGVVIQQMHESINWWAGDWLLYGERAFDEEAQQYVRDAVERGDESIRQTAWVAECFHPSKRQPRLSWTHHRIAAGLDEPLRYEVLEMAASSTPVWSTRRLQEHIDGLTAIDGEVVGSSSEPAEQPWLEAAEDLTDTAREGLLERMGAHKPADKKSFSQGFVAGLRWGRVRDAFAHWGS